MRQIREKSKKPVDEDGKSPLFLRVKADTKKFIEYLANDFNRSLSELCDEAFVAMFPAEHKEFLKSKKTYKRKEIIPSARLIKRPK